MKAISKFFALMFLITVSCLQLTAGSDSTKTQDGMQTLIPAEGYTSGGFGGPVVKVGPIDGGTGVFFGGRGGWVINRTFVIGGGGYGYTDMMHHNNSALPDTGIAFGYGGLELEYLIGANNLIHATILTLIGGGGFTVNEYYGGQSEDWDGSSLYSAGCFVFEPTLNAEVNILSWMRLCVGVGYRFVTGIDATMGSRHYSNSTVSGVFGAGTLKFGPY